jgi:hypothetical protein
MSDFNDLIARNAIMAYHEGLERGALDERDRIVSMLKEQIVTSCPCKHCDLIKENIGMILEDTNV